MWEISRVSIKKIELPPFLLFLPATQCLNSIQKKLAKLVRELIASRKLENFGKRKMVKSYQHIQIGYLMIITLAIALLFIASLMAVYGFNWVVFTVLIILGICLVLFNALTVLIEEDILEIHFGPGVIRKKFSLKDIESCQVVKNPWYYGWGIHLTPYGWLYNVSGFYAVEIRMKTGKKYRIGTNVPNDLEKVILQSIERTEK